MNTSTNYSTQNQKKQFKNGKNKIPFAVFVCPKNQNEGIRDYKEEFTDIISDRIQKKLNDIN